MDKRTALITGASRGIGRAIAKKIAKQGFDLALVCDKSVDILSSIAKDLEKEYGVSVKVYGADLSSEQDIVRLYDDVNRDFDRIDILVNNAGICIDKELNDRSLDDFRHTMSVNLYAPFLLSKLFGYDMKRREYGKIVNISSNNADKCFYPTTIDYDVSKAGLNVLTKDFAIELAPFVNVNAVCPGWVKTDMSSDLMIGDIEELEAQKILKRRIAMPQDIASLVLFLCSDDASYINGEVITIDGGMF